MACEVNYCAMPWEWHILLEDVAPIPNEKRKNRSSSSSSSSRLSASHMALELFPNSSAWRSSVLPGTVLVTKTLEKPTRLRRTITHRFLSALSTESLAESPCRLRTRWKTSGEKLEKSLKMSVSCPSSCV